MPAPLSGLFSFSCYIRGMKLSLIINPTAGGGEPRPNDVRARIQQALDDLGEQDHVDVYRTQGAGDATRFAAQVCQEAREHDAPHTLLVAGGDGTLHEAIQPLSDAPSERFTLGLIPRGTGNDFARTLGLELEHIPEWLHAWTHNPDHATDTWQRRAIDLLRITRPDHNDPRLAVNAITGGASAAVARALDDAQKQRLGALAYARAALDTAERIRPSDDPHDDTLAWSISVELKDGTRESADILGLIIANGSTAGGGWRVAPHAQPDDGVLDLLLYLTPSSRLQLPAWLAQLAGGDVSQHDHVVSLSTRSLDLRAPDGKPLPLRADGEDIDPAPIHVDLLPQILHVWHPPSQTA